MNNLLKKYCKILLKLNLSLALVLSISSVANSKSSSKRVSSSRSVKKSIRGQSSVSNVPRASIKKDENISETPVAKQMDTSGITKYNCETLYNKCMNEYCYSDQNGRCGCNEIAKFNSADAECKYIYSNFPNLEKDIVATYKRNAKFDCSNFVISDIKNTQVSLSNILANLTTCMRKKCKSKSEEFVGCFDEDNFEKKFELCKNTYENASDKELLKSMFKDSVKDYKKKYCEEIFGTIESDGECYLNIGFGPSFKDIKKKKKFKVGDEIICSEKEFGTTAGSSKVVKMQAVKEITLFGADALGAVLNSTSSLVGNDWSEKGFGLGTLDATTETLNLAAGALGSSHLGGMLMGVETLKDKDAGAYTGYCYVIKGDIVKELFEASDEYYYKLRWGDDWNMDFQYTETGDY